jgi:spermidine/putrescine transport system substrate-binding protein
MKRALFAVLLVSLLFLQAQVPCADTPKLYIFNWSYYIPDDVLKDFEKQFSVKLVYDVYSSNEEMYTKLKAGGGGYDVVFPSGDYVSIMIKENMLEKLDKSKLPNFKHLDESILVKIGFDKDNAYSVPFVMGAAGIAVNKKYVKDYPRNYHIYERADLKGRMTLLDEPREVIGNALKTLGYSCNSTSEKELQEAKALVLKWTANIMKFDSESFGKSFAAGEFWVVNGYGENVFNEIDEDMKKDIDFFIPDTGGTMYLDNMVILKGSKNLELAYKFINFIHEPKIYARIMDYLSLPSVNVAARELVTSEPIYLPRDLLKCELEEDLGENLELWNKLWQEIRIGN